MPRLDGLQIEQAVKQDLRPLERHVRMVPIGITQFGKVLPAGCMFFEAYLGCLFDTAPYGNVAAIQQLQLNEKGEFFEQVDMLEKEEMLIAGGEQTKIDQSSKGGLA